MVSKLRDLSSVSMVVSLEERAIRGGQIRSLVWEKRVWSRKNELAAQNLCFAFRMLRGPNRARIILRGLLEDSFCI